MPFRRKKRPPSDASVKGAGSQERPTEIMAPLDACRCKEVSRMTPKGLLGLMLSDLTFWKRRRK